MTANGIDFDSMNEANVEGFPHLLTTQEVAARIDAVSNHVDLLADQIKTNTEVMAGILEQIAAIAETVGPTLEGLKNSPIGKMMGV